MKVAIIGAGHMGGAMARGWARGFGAETLWVANPSEGKLAVLKQEFPDLSVTTSNVEAARAADVVVIAVKPWKVAEVVGELRTLIVGGRKTVLSVAAGVRPADLADLLSAGENPELPPLFYVIPNTAVAVGKGMTFYTAMGASAEDCRRIEALFEPLGRCVGVEPRQMDAGMAVASCGIAYAMRYIRAAVEGGVELGLRPAEAQRAVMQTLAGAVALLEANGTHPEQEIDRVTTPGGITIRGLNAMEEAGFTASVIKGLRASK